MFPLSGLNLQGEPSCASTDLPVGHGNKEKDRDSQETSEPIAPDTSSKTILERDSSTLKVGTTILRHCYLPIN